MLVLSVGSLGNIYTGRRILLTAPGQCPLVALKPWLAAILCSRVSHMCVLGALSLTTCPPVSVCPEVPSRIHHSYSAWCWQPHVLSSAHVQFVFSGKLAVHAPSLQAIY